MPREREFKYDLMQLIECVKDRPCLWDKSLDNYKDRIERRSAWEDIFFTLEDKYEEMTREEKRFVGEQVLSKWTNLRDCFLKSLKLRNGKPKKKYLYHNELKFLIKDLPAEDEASFTEENTEEAPQECTGSRRKRTKRARTESKEDYATNDLSVDFETDGNFVSCEEGGSRVIEEGDPRVMNEDEAFFASLLPTVVQYDIDERLEFRMDVLAVMKNINEKRKWRREQDES